MLVRSAWRSPEMRLFRFWRARPLVTNAVYRLPNYNFFQS
jgi:hypothetical protein